MSSSFRRGRDTGSPRSTIISATSWCGSILTRCSHSRTRPNRRRICAARLRAREKAKATNLGLLAPQMLGVLFVLLTDHLDQFRIRREPLMDGYGPGFGVSFRIVHCHFDFQMPEIGALKALDDLAGFRYRT